jgi:hypothetical protein
MRQSFLQIAQKWRSAILAGCRIFNDDTGGAMLELAFVISIFGAPLIIGTGTTAIMVYDSIEVTNAAHAGSGYGMMSSTFASDTAGITAAAKEEAGDMSNNLNVTPTIFFACSAAPAGTEYTTQTAANTACTGVSNHSLEFIRVVTNTSIPSPFNLPGVPSTFVLGGTSVMEVEE